MSLSKFNDGLHGPMLHFRSIQLPTKIIFSLLILVKCLPAVFLNISWRRVSFLCFWLCPVQYFQYYISCYFPVSAITRNPSFYLLSFLFVLIIYVLKTTFLSYIQGQFVYGNCELLPKPRKLDQHCKGHPSLITKRKL